MADGKTQLVRLLFTDRLNALASTHLKDIEKEIWLKSSIKPPNYIKKLREVIKKKKHL